MGFVRECFNSEQVNTDQSEINEVHEVNNPSKNQGDSELEELLAKQEQQRQQIREELLQQQREKQQVKRSH